MVGIFAEVERIASAGKALYARRVESTAAFEKDGHRSAASWLAQVSGEPVGQAIGVLEATREMEQTPATMDAFASGELSMAQAREIAGAGTRDPEVERQLLQSARTESFRELKQRVAREKRHRHTEEEEHAREARVHASRYLRSWEPPEGGLRIEAWLTKLDGAQLLAGIESAANQAFKDVVATESYESLERYRADALVRLCTGDVRGSRLAPPRVLVRVDAASLRRGSVKAGEVCEIAGVGAVSVETACLRRTGLQRRSTPRGRSLADRLREGRPNHAVQPGPTLQASPRAPHISRLAPTRRAGALALGRSRAGHRITPPTRAEQARRRQPNDRPRRAAEPNDRPRRAA
jgi:hypothetical protein